MPFLQAEHPGGEQKVQSQYGQRTDHDGARGGARYAFRRRLRFKALVQRHTGHRDAKDKAFDNAVADMLKEQGIECARRTVAKYREALRIAPTNLRKTL